MLFGVVWIARLILIHFSLFRPTSTHLDRSPSISNYIEPMPTHPDRSRSILNYIEPIPTHVDPHRTTPNHPELHRTISNTSNHFAQPSTKSTLPVTTKC